MSAVLKCFFYLSDCAVQPSSCHKQQNDDDDERCRGWGTNRRRIGWCRSRCGCSVCRSRPAHWSVVHHSLHLRRTAASASLYCTARISRRWPMCLTPADGMQDATVPFCCTTGPVRPSMWVLYCNNASSQSQRELTITSATATATV